MKSTGNAIYDKSFRLAVLIVELTKSLTNEKKEFVLSKQLLRSGTSIGANVREANDAQSRRDFVGKLAIALKEANETEYWLDLLHETQYIDENIYRKIKAEITEVLRLLNAIIKTTKQKLDD